LARLLRVYSGISSSRANPTWSHIEEEEIILMTCFHFKTSVFVKGEAPNNTLHPTRFPLQFDPSAKLRGANFHGKRAAERGVMRKKNKVHY